MKTNNLGDRGMLDQAIDALQLNVGLDIKLAKYEALDKQADAIIKIVINNRKFEFVVDFKHIDRFANIAQVKYRLDAFNLAPLLIAPKLTDAAINKCKDLGLNFIDLAGNAYINLPDIFIFIKGQKLDKYQNNPMAYIQGSNTLKPTNMRMMFVLLCNPELLNAPYREIAKVAGIALGTVGWGFNDLAARKFTLGDGKKNNRVFIQQEKLIQEWVINYPIKLRPKLNPRRYKANKVDWWKNLDIKKYEAQWGGEVAADKLTHYLKPIFFTLYMHGKDMKKNLTNLIVENRFVPDKMGDIEILEAFWDFDDADLLPEIAPTLLVYADLIASNDPRNLETAKMIYDRLLPHANH